VSIVTVRPFGVLLESRVRRAPQQRGNMLALVARAGVERVLRLGLRGSPHAADAPAYLERFQVTAGTNGPLEDGIGERTYDSSSPLMVTVAFCSVPSKFGDAAPSTW
jgi:hypothetical protein